MSANGLVTRKSDFGAQQTLERLLFAIRSRGLSIFVHIDHAAGAREAGMQLPPTDLIIFGSTKAGTPLMLAHPEISIDLPLKAIVWQDAQGTTSVSYNDPIWLAARHFDPTQHKDRLVAMARSITEIAQYAATAQ